jgi:hypothetical protein
VKRGSWKYASHTLLRHREIDVVADHVHQLERAHAESARFAHDRVDGRGIRGALGQQAERLCIETDARSD